MPKVCATANNLYVSNHSPGRRRNLAASTIASFVVLSAVGSLGYALCLFFVTILYTPLTQHNNDTPRHDALFTPKPAVLYVPVILSLVTLNGLPGLLEIHEDITLLRIGYVVVPLFLAFAPQVRNSLSRFIMPTDSTRPRSFL